MVSILIYSKSFNKSSDFMILFYTSFDLFPFPGMYKPQLTISCVML